MDGFEVICKICCLFNYNCMLIIVLIVNVLLEDSVVCFFVGMNYFLIKFIDEDVFK